MHLNPEQFEWLLNAQINFQNVEKMNPGLKAHPIYRMAKEQLDNAIRVIDQSEGADAQGAT